jgi:hypothetical protein
MPHGNLYGVDGQVWEQVQQVPCPFGSSQSCVPVRSSRNRTRVELSQEGKAVGDGGFSADVVSIRNEVGSEEGFIRSPVEVVLEVFKGCNG